MHDQYQLRTFEGKAILSDHLKKIKEGGELFLSALKGFHRDLAISAKNYPKYLNAEFEGQAGILAVPPLVNGGDFAGFSEMVKLAEKTMEGDIYINFPWIINQEQGKKVLEEVEITHKNIMLVSETAGQLYKLAEKAEMEFDMFNGKNSDVGYPEADIIFNRDSLNVSIATLRAISERAIRMDIDLVSKMEEKK